MAEAESAEIAALVREHYEHLATRNWAGLAAHFWPGATILRVQSEPNAEATALHSQTVEDFLAGAARLPTADDPLVVELVDCDVAIADRVAHALARYRARSGSADDVHAWDGADAFVLLRRDGCWKVGALLVGTDLAGD